MNWVTHKAETAVASDWISINKPIKDASDLSDWTVQEAADASATGTYLWGYMDRGVTVNEKAVIPAGAWSGVAINEERDVLGSVGRYAVVMLLRDTQTVAAIWYLRVRSKSDPVCTPLATMPASGADCEPNGALALGGGGVKANTCECNEGFFGPHCGSGCAPLTRLTSFGQNVFSSLDQRPVYQNSRKCVWQLVPPQLPGLGAGGPTGVRFSFSKLAMENGDTVTIEARVRNASTGAAELVSYTYRGYQNAAITVPQINSTDVNLTFATNSFNPSTQDNLGFTGAVRCGAEPNEK